MKYGIISDTHCHNWTTFGSTNVAGVNTRLEIILSEILRAAEETAKMGGTLLFHAGDIFHVRGTIAPSVLNPTLECFKRVVNEYQILPVLLCGNHDAEFRDANDVGSAISALEGVGCKVINEPTVYCGFVLMPWIRDKEQFLKTLEKMAVEVDDRSFRSFDLICHAPIDGALKRFSSAECFHPDDIKKAAGPKLDRVFAGHIHNHKRIAGQNMWSVGAIAHHNWGDIGTKAGFILVNEEEVEFRASRAPEFVEITPDMSETDAMLASDGNYVRATVEDLDEADIKDFRYQLEAAGAKGVTIINHKKPEEVANRIKIDSSESLESVVAKYVDKQVTGMPADKAKSIVIKANELLREAENAI